MGESLNHVRLVKAIIERVSSLDPQAVILADTSIYAAKDRPPKIGGHVPDVYARIDMLRQTIIGEAKTGKDLENEHTMSQLRAYLSHCSTNPGTRLVLAVPWDMRSFVHNLLNRLKTQMMLPKESVEILHCFIS
ncbi:hypothetical protein KI809_09355 [Geobacter pelophilus]|uniref:PD-(D/E)XK nuclease superfamily protein n=1 Tax=Geoanaerobacter pelophilus TaxID=60036 RepID=A0AAW4L4P1_9BACT|nr:hypothetical protein [Geoanaerobacter pelophilus]MBT0664505.1 hypothetical protein [Geoanaerobacter pelophilus]